MKQERLEGIQRMLEAVLEEGREQGAGQARALPVLEIDPPTWERELEEAQHMPRSSEEYAPLPEKAALALRGLLASMREGGPTVSATMAIEAEPPEAMVSLVEEPQLGPPTRIVDLAQPPLWIHPGDTVVLPVASAEVMDERTFDFSSSSYPGKVMCELRLETEYEGEGLLRVRWRSDHAPQDGWWVAMYLPEQRDPCFDDLLGTDAQGEAVFSALALGFDPMVTPFRYLIYPR